MTIIDKVKSGMEISSSSSNKLEAIEKCYVCGSYESFFCEEGTSMREAKCPECGASRSNSDLAKVIANTYVGSDRSLPEILLNLEDLDIYEAQSNGPIHSQLSRLPKYICSEYFCDVTTGPLNEFGVRCEDLQSISFPNNTFDLVITQDVLEHAIDPEKAFSEILRVLKPGGYHIFTVPYHEGKKSLKRVKIKEGKEIYLSPPVYHIDPLRKNGALVCTDFDEDLTDLLSSLGYETDIVFSSKWYDSKEIPNIEDESSYKIYQTFYEKNNLAKYLKYNSIVFRSKKIDGKKWKRSTLDNTGERYLPFVDPMITGAEIHYEHLHRYAFVSQFVKDKYVLDLASGEGYGSYLLSNEASGVVGVELDEDAVAHSCAKYSKNNLEFKRGSILRIPINGSKIFDVIVCFEALEHVEDHDRLFSEVKRLLKDGGLFIVSTPNKKVYSDEANYHNPFHLKELYFDDFKNILHRYFSYEYLYGQRVFTGSNIWHLLSNNESYCNEFVIEKEDNNFTFKSKMDKVPMYFISIASDAPLDEVFDKTSYLIDKSNILTARRDDQITSLSNQFQQAIKGRDDQITSLSNQLQQANAHASSLEYEITEIRKSAIWQLTMKFHNGFVERALPQNSRRRRWYDLGLKGGRILMNEGLQQAICKFRDRWQSKKEINVVENNKKLVAYDINNIYKKYILNFLDISDHRSLEYMPLSPNYMNLMDNDVKLIAFYLPQYHPIPENDKWWGKGFTDWTNVSKAVPQFVGHYQPQLPDELGFYDLRLIEIQKRQIELARQYGIYGFCFHYYWFNGKKLLEKPLNQFLNNKELNFPFCICWANENWTRRWDGMENDILIAQVHSPENDIAFIKDLEPFFRDPRYIRINDKPILIVYRVPLLPNARATAERWRMYCREQGVGDIFLIAAQTFGFKDPRTYGFDAAVEFPPHTMPGCSCISDKIDVINPKFSGKIWDYNGFVKSKRYLGKVPYKLFKAIVPGWDNTARRPNSASIFHGSNPINYREWLWNIVEWTTEVHPAEERVVFINAWNEWAEGAHLEPDRKYGYGYLQATSEVIQEFRKKIVIK